MFEKARLKLTLWYLFIIMAISILFSFAIYTTITGEFRRFERLQVRIRENIEPPQSPGRFVARIGTPDPAFIQAAKTRIIMTLGIINLAILGIAGGLGYFLAGKTLKPIKKMVDEQNRFISDSSHELRTPLTSLRSEIEVGLRNKKLSLLESKKLLESNLEEVISLQALSDNLLELAQNGNLINPQSFEDVSLQEIIEIAIKKINSLAGEKQIIIKSSVKNVKIRGISDRLSEVFVILLDNAVKYSPHKSKITLSSELKAGNVKVSVTDRGIGIDKKDIPHIFERFYRSAKSRTKNDVPGYGLGLSIAKKIVESHGGLIFVKSEPNKGTTFSITLPLQS